MIRRISSHLSLRDNSFHRYAYATAKCPLSFLSSPTSLCTKGSTFASNLLVNRSPFVHIKFYASSSAASYDRLRYIRNVGILAHVDAGKTTVTERMLALTGVVHQAGSVDNGNTVTDFLPAERERGITIQSAAISFHWDWHNASHEMDQVKINLIDTPGHVDFSVEVNRSVAVLDGAVLVLDSVAGVQAQTETVWKAITKSTSNLASSTKRDQSQTDTPSQEPMPCIALINKMDKDGCHFLGAIQSISRKLPGANPMPIQLPLFKLDRPNAESKSIKEKATSATNSHLPPNLVALPYDSNSNASNTYSGRASFVGTIDLIHMRIIIYPEVMSSKVSDVEECKPQIISLLSNNSDDDDWQTVKCPVTKLAMQARADLIAQLANFDEKMEEYFLLEEEPTNNELRLAIRRATLRRDIIPVLAGAALRGNGVEPVLDAIADFLPSPLDRLPPALIRQSNKAKKKKKTSAAIPLGHPHHPILLALAFKVVHMKNRGGSGDGRVVFARVYSGKIKSKDVLKIITPTLAGGQTLIASDEKPRTERVSGMLELSGGRFGNLENGVCESGEVCALVGLKSVVTGDTLMLKTDTTFSKGSSNKGKKRKGQNNDLYKNVEDISSMGDICLAGAASPKPVLTVRIEASSLQEQARLSEALTLLSIEDPSLNIEENETATLLSGLGELHIEVTVDRLKRDFGLEVTTGPPAVAYHETLLNSLETENGGLCYYDRTIGETRLQAAVHIVLEPFDNSISDDGVESNIVTLSEPSIILAPKARAFLELDEFIPEEELYYTNDLARALLSGCQGSLRRGAIGPYPMANVKCHILDIEAEGGLSYLNSMPGALRASAANAISTLFASPLGKKSCTVLEPSMSLEVTTPPSMVGAVLSDLSTRRGVVGDVIMEDGVEQVEQTKALIQGYVPLVEILGYATSLRSLSGGEAAFSAEYKGHSPSDRF